MKKKPKPQPGGFTLVECLIVMLVLMISMGGLIGFRYYSVLCAERAETRLLAARAAQVLVESWKGHKGDSGYDPVQQGFDADFQIYSNPMMDISPMTDFLSQPGSVLLGKYRIQTEERQFGAVLTYRDTAGIGNVRTLFIRLNWTDPKGLAQSYDFSTVTQTVL